jgi:hypothetical protein
MMTCQASRDDTPRLKEAGETSLAAGTSALAVTHLRRIHGSVIEILDMYRSFTEVPSCSRT